MNLSAYHFQDPRQDFEDVQITIGHQSTVNSKLLLWMVMPHMKKLKAYSNLSNAGH